MRFLQQQQSQRSGPLKVVVSAAAAVVGRSIWRFTRDAALLKKRSAAADPQTSKSSSCSLLGRTRVSMLLAALAGPL